MKKHKSVVAILLAVMMIFTMMPTLAFATNQQSATSWGDKAVTITDKDGDSFKTVRTFGNDGLIEAVGQDNTAVVPATVAPSDGVYFTDFENSALTFNNGVKLDGTSWKYENFAAGHGLELTLTEPDYADGYNAKSPKKVVVPFETSEKDAQTGVTTWTAVVNGWTVTVEESKFDEGSEADQTVTFAAKVAPLNKVEGTKDAPDAFGKPATATITVKGLVKTVDNAKVYLDAVNPDNVASAKNGGSLTGLYDGDAHTVVADAVSGYTVSYEIYDESTGKYTAATSVSITDVQKPAMKFRVVFTKDNNSIKGQDITLNLVQAQGAEFSFRWDKDDYYNYGVAGTEYNATDYIDVVPNEYYTSAQAAGAKEQKAADAATVKAVAKNEAQIRALFAEKYDVIPEQSKYNDNVVYLTIEKKDLSDAEEKAIDKKYEALIANVGPITVDTDVTASVYLNGKDWRDFRVSFTKSTTSKVFKGKKVIKKAKLKKKQTIAFTATCENGSNVKYKISGNTANGKITINKKTGVVTCKKGLKKGTYKVKVTAYVPTNGNAALAEFATDVVDLKIVVKKK